MGASFLILYILLILSNHFAMGRPEQRGASHPFAKTDLRTGVSSTGWTGITGWVHPFLSCTSC